MHSAAQIRAFAAWLRNKGSTLSILNSRSTGVRWSPWAAGGRGPAAEANGRSLATPTRTGARPFPGCPTGARAIAGGAVTTRPWGRAAGPGSTVGMAAMSATTPWTARRGRPGRPRVGGPAGCRAWRLAAGATVAAGTRAVTGSWRSSRGGAHRFWRWRRQGQGSAVGGALLGPAVAASSPRPEGREARAGPLGQRSRLRGAGRACTLVVRRWGPGPLPVEAEEPPLVHATAPRAGRGASARRAGRRETPSSRWSPSRAAPWPYRLAGPLGRQDGPASLGSVAQLPQLRPSERP